jgi:hypothetical protein
MFACFLFAMAPARKRLQAVLRNMCGARGCEPSLPKQIVNLLCERRGRAGAAEARYVCARGALVRALKCSGTPLGGYC